MRFDQSGKQVLITYDLKGDTSVNFTISLYYSVDDSLLQGPLRSTTGNVGMGQKAGIGKQIIWNVLDELDKLTGEVSFTVKAEEVSTANKIPMSNIKPDEIIKKVPAEVIPVIKVFDSSGTFIDSRDGKSYKWIRIGTQIWMAENLGYLPSVSSSNTSSDSQKHYYVYGYDSTSVIEAKQSIGYPTYGVLYNWLAAQDACPFGWHLSTDEEWKILEQNQLMSESDAKFTGWRNSGIVGGKLKEVGANHWNSPNKIAAFSSGFNALPGGYLRYNRGFLSLGSYAYFWSPTEEDDSYACGRLLRYYREGVYRNTWNKRVGLSIRCLKNESGMPKD